jgi:Alpha/beta hydrolase
MTRLTVLLASLLLAGCALASDARRYVLYVHGRAVEEGGRRPETRFGVYEYDAILETFRKAGFEVISEQRPKDADPSDSADRVVAAVRRLRRRGVPSSHITVIGASKGSVITMLASTRLADPEIRYVLLGNCNDGILERWKPRLSGRVLSVFERADEYGGTCRRFFEKGHNLTAHDEVALDIGIGHAFLYSPRPDWVTPAIEWARR